jgi:hypothetical protein
MLFDASSRRRCGISASDELRAALKGAKKRTLGDAWAWSRKNSGVDITPLVSFDARALGRADDRAAEAEQRLEAAVVAVATMTPSRVDELLAWSAGRLVRVLEATRGQPRSGTRGRAVGVESAAAAA